MTIYHVRMGEAFWTANLGTDVLMTGYGASAEEESDQACGSARR